MSEPLPVAVLVSGSGTNLQALIDASHADAGYRIAVVVSDRPGVHALTRAEAFGIPTEVVAWSDHADRTAFTHSVCEAVVSHGASAIVLAGFMRILAPEAIDRFPDAIINVHPALLPAFPGADAVPQALAYGVPLTGVTVHFVDEQVDHGPIIAQEAVRIEPGDDEASLHARLQQVEHRLLPAVVSDFGKGRLSVEGRLVIHHPEPEVAR